MKKNTIYLFLILIMLLASVWLGWLSLSRYRGYAAGMYDLGNMSQAIWSVTQGKPLVYTDPLGPKSRLSWHAEFIYFLIAPLYAVFPTPETLLLLQVALYSLGALPLYKLAHRRLKSPKWALIIPIIYLLYPSAQNAVLFDFHGDTLAMPFLLFALEALDRRARRDFSIWTAIALLCKFYVAAPVAALGLVLWFKGERRVGLATSVIGLLWGIVIFFLVRPVFLNPDTSQTGEALVDYQLYYFGYFNGILATLAPRVLSMIVVFGPALLLGARAPLWLLPGLVIAFPALSSNGPGPSYDYVYHHFALTVPFSLAAIVYGAAAFKEKSDQMVVGSRRKGRTWQGDLLMSLGITCIFSVAFVSTPLNPVFYAAPPGERLKAAGYEVSARDRFKDQWLKENVPPDARIAATTMLAAHLTSRETLYTSYYSEEDLARVLPQVDYFVLDAFFDLTYGSPMELEQKAVGLLLRNAEVRLIQARDGLLLFSRQGKGLVQNAEIVGSDSSRTAINRFDDKIGLISFESKLIADHRYRFRYEWKPLPSFRTDQSLFAVSRIGGADHMRIVHLPTLALLPTPDWAPDCVVREEFDVLLAEGLEPGEYPLWVGWYDLKSPYASETDSRSRIGDEVQIGVLKVP